MESLQKQVLFLPYGLAILFVIYILTIIIYRLTLHPLSHYPGPLLARISDIDNIYHVYAKTRHTNLLRCHEIYGHVYRYGPNQLSFNSASALRDIYGRKANVKKAEFYGYAFSPHMTPNVLNLVDKTAHARQRKMIGSAFSERALRGMEEVVAGKTGMWCEVIGVMAGRGEVVNMSDWCTYLMFDTISELTFGKSYDMIHGSERWLPKYLAETTALLNFMGNFPTLSNALSSLHLTNTFFPGVQKKRQAFAQFCIRRAEERRRLGPKKEGNQDDLFDYFMKATDSETGEGFRPHELWGQSILMHTAGSDTTATALAGMFFYLSHNPRVLSILSREIRDTFQDSGEVGPGGKLNSCVYLRACIDETLRLAPPAPGILPRVVCPGGAVIDGHFIPEGVEVGVASWVLNRNAGYFSSPNEFRPERWILGEGVRKEDFERAQAAFFPFSTGPRACIARNLAGLVMSAVVARVVLEFDFVVVGEEEEKSWELGDQYLAIGDGPMIKICAKEI